MITLMEKLKGWFVLTVDTRQLTVVHRTKLLLCPQAWSGAVEQSLRA